MIGPAGHQTLFHDLLHVTYSIRVCGGEIDVGGTYEVPKTFESQVENAIFQIGDPDFSFEFQADENGKTYPVYVSGTRESNGCHGRGVVRLDPSGPVFGDFEMTGLSETCRTGAVAK